MQEALVVVALMVCLSSLLLKFALTCDLLMYLHLLPRVLLLPAPLHRHYMSVADFAEWEGEEEHTWVLQVAAYLGLLGAQTAV